MESVVSGKMQSSCVGPSHHRAKVCAVIKVISMKRINSISESIRGSALLIAFAITEGVPMLG